MTRVVSKPLGRPVSTGRGHGVRVTVRLSPEEAVRIERRAKRAGQTVATWIREQALGAAEG